MSDYWVGMALSVLFSVLKGIIKNPEKKQDMRAANIKLYKSIKIAYAEDIAAHPEEWEPF